MPQPGTTLYPLLFEPVLKAYPWGGSSIGDRLGRKTPPGPIAESWEISGHPSGPTRAVNGPLAGKDLPSLMRLLGEDLVGRRCSEALTRNTFPLLIKILDARQWLSVQVHPSDEYALEHEGDLGKTEMWVVLEADAGAEVLLGFDRPTDRGAFRRAIEKGSVSSLLRRLPARAGDVYFVPPGTVHAIGPGLLLAEIQQSSNATYRVFDWNRTPERPLHLDRSLDVLNFGAVGLEAVTPTAVDGSNAELLAQCPYFRTERIRLEPGAPLGGELSGEAFEIWGAIAGGARLSTDHAAVELSAISWALLPARLGTFRIEATEPSTLLRVTVP